MSRKKPSSPKDETSAAATAGRARRRSTRLLAEDETRLWAEVAKTLQPLKAKHRSARPSPSAGEPTQLPAKWREAAGLAPEQAAIPPGDDSKKQALKHGKGAREAKPARKQIPDLKSFSRRELRQISSGRETIDAKLDLHGLRQAEAHVALKGFLMHSQSRDLRHVLVITGKGKARSNADIYRDESEPGVLRRVVPMWLAEADMRAIVAGYTEAPIRHGGDGALLVRLRRLRD